MFIQDDDQLLAWDVLQPLQHSRFFRGNSFENREPVSQLQLVGAGQVVSVDVDFVVDIKLSELVPPSAWVAFVILLVGRPLEFDQLLPKF